MSVFRWSTLLLAVALAVSGCMPFANRDGAGLDLFTARTPAATNNLSNYFQELCAQTNLMPSGAATTCSNGNALVRAGFNDIDLRCDRYLAWVDGRRAEATLVDSMLASTTQTLQAILQVTSPGTDSIFYIGQVLGFANDVYDAQNNFLLLGLESSTIRRIVYERRLEFRRQFSQVPYSDTADMVFALRSYLRICTPQNIALDANTYAMMTASGLPTTSVADRVEQERSAIMGGRSPVTIDTPAATIIDRSEVRCPACAELFADSGYTSARIRAVQLGLCMPQVDGISGPETLAAAMDYRRARGSSRQGLLGNFEYDDIVDQGCQAGERERGLMTFYEAIMSDNPAELVRFVQNLNTVLSTQSPDASTVTFASTLLRQHVVSARGRLNLQTGDAVRDTHITEDLVRQVGLAATN